MTRILACIAASIVTAIFAASGQAAAPQPWVEVGNDGMLSVRAVVATGTPCPRVTADGRNIPVKKRLGPDERFPLELCDAHAPAASAKIAVGGKAVPTLPATVRRIVVLGDTGCRIEGPEVQDCQDPKSWPFHTVSERAAARHPDLVIHVGDYLYRLSPCPAGNTACAGPSGDNWPTWQADFFGPAAPLLDAAPWVMVRGNHEICRRGGEGWRHLIDPHPGELACSDFEAPYRVSAGGLTLLVFDSANADDFKAEPDKVPLYAGQLRTLLAAAPPHSWLLTHRPV